jgi:hypothetical protein
VAPSVQISYPRRFPRKTKTPVEIEINIVKKLRIERRSSVSLTMMWYGVTPKASYYI